MRHAQPRRAGRGGAKGFSADRVCVWIGRPLAARRCEECEAGRRLDDRRLGGLEPFSRSARNVQRVQAVFRDEAGGFRKCLGRLRRAVQRFQGPAADGPNKALKLARQAETRVWPCAIRGCWLRAGLLAGEYLLIHGSVKICPRRMFIGRRGAMSGHVGCLGFRPVAGAFRLQAAGFICQR